VYREFHPEYIPQFSADDLKRQPDLLYYCLEQGFIKDISRAKKLEFIQEILLTKETKAPSEEQQALLKRFIDDGAIFTLQEKEDFFNKARAIKRKEFFKKGIFKKKQQKEYVFKHPSNLKVPVESFLASCDTERNYIILTQNEDGTLHYTVKNNQAKIVSGDTTTEVEVNLREVPEIFFERFWYGAGGQEGSKEGFFVSRSLETENLMDEIYIEIRNKVLKEEAREAIAPLEAEYESMVVRRSDLVPKVVARLLPDYLQAACASNALEETSNPLIQKIRAEKTTPERFTSETVAVGNGPNIMDILGDVIGGYVGPTGDDLEGSLARLESYLEPKKVYLPLVEPTMNPFDSIPALNPDEVPPPLEASLSLNSPAPEDANSEEEEFIFELSIPTPIPMPTVIEPQDITSILSTLESPMLTPT